MGYSKGIILSSLKRSKGRKLLWEPYSEDNVLCPRYMVLWKITCVIFWHQMLAPIWDSYSNDKSPCYRVCTGNYPAEILAPKFGAKLEPYSEKKSPHYRVCMGSYSVQILAPKFGANLEPYSKDKKFLIALF